MTPFISSREKIKVCHGIQYSVTKHFRRNPNICSIQLSSDSRRSIKILLGWQDFTVVCFNLCFLFVSSLLFPFHLCSELGAVTLTNCQYFLILLNEDNLPAKSDPENLHSLWVWNRLDLYYRAVELLAIWNTNKYCFSPQMLWIVLCKCFLKPASQKTLT